MKKYLEKIVIYKGGTVAHCWGCKKMRGLRFVKQTRNIAPESPSTWQDVQIYNLCDTCADKEKQMFEQADGEVVDARETAKNPITQNAIL